mmetsp:Transcript_32327/g.47441  ORF Transcript_32327/g.47441 Transcript_32327/m.47441 type:complete len:497 (+) Transcript_32327:214-1704(+)
MDNLYDAIPIVEMGPRPFQIYMENAFCGCNLTLEDGLNVEFSSDDLVEYSSDDDRDEDEGTVEEVETECVRDKVKDKVEINDLLPQLLPQLENAESKVFGAVIMNSYCDLNSRIKRIRDEIGFTDEKYSSDDAKIEMSILETKITELEFCINKAQDQLYGQMYSRKVAWSLPDELNSLEEELGLEQKGEPLITRISNIENNIGEVRIRIEKVQDQHEGQMSANKASGPLPDKLRILEIELDLDQIDKPLITRISSIEKRIDELRLRVNKIRSQFYGQIYACKATKSLPEELNIIEEELGLEQKDELPIARIKSIEETITSINACISKLEAQIFEQKNVDEVNESLTNRLKRLEKKLGADESNFTLILGITILEEYVESTKCRIFDIERCVCDNNYCYSGKTESPLALRLSSLEEEMEINSREYSIESRLSHLEEKLGQRVVYLEERVFREVRSDAKGGSLLDRLKCLGKELSVEKYEITELSMIDHLEEKFFSSHT